MTSDIETARLCGDTPVEYDRHRGGLGLVEFAFVPHLDSITGGLARLQDYARQSKKKVYACRDGDGIIVQDDQVRCLGEVVVIEPDEGN